MGVVHSSPDTNCVQEVEQLEKQKNEAKDEKEKEEIEKTLVLKQEENNLAWLRKVRQSGKVKVGKTKNLTIRTDVVCHEVALGSVQWGMW